MQLGARHPRQQGVGISDEARQCRDPKPLPYSNDLRLAIRDEDATVPVVALAKQLGFAPVKLGKLDEGGALVQARGRTWGQLIFQDLFKKEQ